MHAAETPVPANATPDSVEGVLDFLWLELTNRCNLQCVHCYTESDPWSGGRDLLEVDDYESLMAEAYRLGCRKIQLIGGEPQLNPSFKRLLRYSIDSGFEFVEVYTNLTRLDDETLELAAENGVYFATSVYSDDPAVHDAVTTVRGSHRRTISNLQRLIDHGVKTRAAVLTMDGDDEAVERTKQYLVEMGTLAPSRLSSPKAFGRGEDLLGKPAHMTELCGHCWNGNLAVAPDGCVYPCVMARDWPVGNVLTESLEDILHGEALDAIRRDIHETVWQPLACYPNCHQSCNPDLSCPCDPLMCPKSCTPLDQRSLPSK
jgi:MoaA/NifB/PqqE/SkfB family radical SAM enzyme